MGQDSGWLAAARSDSHLPHRMQEFVCRLGHALSHLQTRGLMSCLGHLNAI